MQTQTSSKPGLNQQQQDAAQTLDRHISLTAGPGSGKTTVLIERFINILSRKDVSLEHVVAITFTNRAANQIRTRLRSAIDLRMRTCEPYERARWLHHKRTLDGAVITTIHGFCSRLLREFPLEAEIDPQFVLLDEFQSVLLEQAVVHEVLNENIEIENSAARLAITLGKRDLGKSILDI